MTSSFEIELIETSSRRIRCRWSPPSVTTTATVLVVAIVTTLQMNEPLSVLWLAVLILGIWHMRLLQLQHVRADFDRDVVVVPVVFAASEAAIAVVDALHLTNALTSYKSWCPHDRMTKELCWVLVGRWTTTVLSATCCAVVFVAIVVKRRRLEAQSVLRLFRIGVGLHGLLFSFVHAVTWGAIVVLSPVKPPATLPASVFVRPTRTELESYGIPIS